MWATCCPRGFYNNKFNDFSGSLKQVTVIASLAQRQGVTIPLLRRTNFLFFRQPETY
ncbi:MAG: hypothetical protein IKZ88_09010 [Neisseriaceae bacterium]|nr:hypothetical protein [Neisseriaceae bacterium]